MVALVWEIIHGMELHVIKVGRSCLKMDIQNGCMPNKAIVG